MESRERDASGEESGRRVVQRGGGRPGSNLKRPRRPCTDFGFTLPGNTWKASLFPSNSPSLLLFYSLCFIFLRFHIINGHYRSTSFVGKKLVVTNFTFNTGLGPTA